MANDANKIIHEFLGKCDHESENPDYATFKCKKCGNSFGGSAMHRELRLMEYDKSLDLLRPAELKAIEVFGADRYEAAIVAVTAVSARHWIAEYGAYVMFALAPASVRASAIVKLIKEQSNDE